MPEKTLVAAALCCLLGAAVAQPSVDPGRLPSNEQLLSVPVGGTHIPVDAKTGDLKNPYEGNTDALVQGRKLFHSMNCVGCHAPQGGGGIGPPLSDKAWIYGGEPGQIYLTIAQGRPNGMPAFGNSMTPESIWKLVTYVRTLSDPKMSPTYEEPPHKQTGKP